MLQFDVLEFYPESWPVDTASVFSVSHRLFQPEWTFISKILTFIKTLAAGAIGLDWKTATNGDVFGHGSQQPDALNSDPAKNPVFTGR